MFTKSCGSRRQLVYCDRGINGRAPVFLDIGSHEPVSLFGGYSHSASICADGEVIFINRNSVKNSPSWQILSSSLLCGESGLNEYGQLGLGKKASSVSLFTEISSLSGHKIRAAYAGCYHSLFERHEGKILVCRYNRYEELLLSSGPSDENTYSPTETTIKESSAFAIAGEFVSTVFIGGDPPFNTPNTPVKT